ncbi:hypothetical protein [Kibdelosporangium aridum]|uniref:hypothetical protein n=1 Tax=Kibdelosporangium aridum TaxID=2030 RepID=UPI00163C8FA7|nr:hypothetical protein [Kibdelosporangium aridum]
MRESPDTHLLVVARGAPPAAGSHVNADLVSLTSVRTAADEIRDRLARGDLPPLHGFVGNAGMQYTNALTEGPDGFEATFAINVLTNHLLSSALRRRRPARTSTATT